MLSLLTTFAKRSVIFALFVLHAVFSTGTSTPFLVAPIGMQSTTTQTITATTTTNSKTNAKTPTTTKKVLPITKVSTPHTTTTAPTPVIPTLPPPDFEAINTFARKAIVNILCTAKGSELSPISGTGILVTKEGVILTNAHVAEYFLLRNYRQKDFIECVIRTGSPAYPRYHAELVYISPTWVEQNKDLLKEQQQKGTGEYDFALLRITDSINGSPLPEFTHIPVNIRENINAGEPVILVSYPAGFLGGLSILQDLSVASAVTTVQDLETFSANKIDLISVGGTIISQRGASGGAVVDRDATLIGMISISTDATTTSGRGLYAITPAYINRTLQSEVDLNLATLLSRDTSEFASAFASTTAPLLTKIITDELNSTTPAH